MGDKRGWEVGEIEGNYAIKKGLKRGSNEKPMPYICYKWVRNPLKLTCLFFLCLNILYVHHNVLCNYGT